MSKRILVVEDQEDNRQVIRARSNREAAARSHPDGCPIANHGRLYRHAPHQSRSRLEIDPYHRGHLLCAQRLRSKTARAAGCDDYVPKPYSPRQLLAKIRQYLA